MSLSNGTFYDFYRALDIVVHFLRTQGLDLFAIKDLMSSRAPNERYVKVYVNFPGRGIVAHKPWCPHFPELVSGIGNATEYGFWFGMLRKDQIVATFSSIDRFTESLGSEFNFRNNLTCSACGVETLSLA